MFYYMIILIGTGENALTHSIVIIYDISNTLLLYVSYYAA